jgi:hypothetical protein
MAGLLDYLEGIGETGATLGTGLLSGVVGAPYGLFKGITSGRYGSPEAVRIAEEEAKKFMERNTYVPRGKVAQEALQKAAQLMEQSKLPPIIPEAIALGSIPRQAYLAQAERRGMDLERAMAPRVERMLERGGAGAGLLSDLAQGTTSQIIDPSKIKTFPKRMTATNKAIKTGGDIANATARDYTKIIEAGKESVRKGEADSLQEATKLIPSEVQQRYELANSVLDQPIQQWTPPSYSLLDRSVMSQTGNIGGVPGVTQADINRYVPAKADVSYINSLANPKNLDIIKRSVERGLGATGGGFYKSYQPMRAALDEANYSPDVFNKGLAATSFASAQNSVALENAIGSLIMRLEQAGIPITKENVLKAHDEFKALTGGGLSMMEGHYAPFAKFLEQGFPSGEKQAQKISSFYQNKTGNFRPYVFDTHEAAGTSYATPYGPYFWGQGGAKDTEYGALESLLQQKIAAPLNLDPAIAQEGRWFGLGELTGLKTGGGDWLDNYEKQAAWSAKELGKELTRKEQQRYVADVFAGKERMLPWWKKDQPIPDVRKKR